MYVAALDQTRTICRLCLGRSEGPGCYCYINNLLRKFADDLAPSYEWVVLDNEAGMEHISRRTTSNIDALIMVLNESPLSVDCARRVVELLGGLKNDGRNTYYVINGAREERVEQIRSRAADIDVEYLGHIPYDDALDEALFAGGSVYGVDSSPAVLKIGEIMAKIEER